LSYYSFSSIFERNSGTSAGYGEEDFDDHWESFANSEACDLLIEIEQFKARQPLLVNQVSYQDNSIWKPGLRLQTQSL
jgi:hypothetical protein